MKKVHFIFIALLSFVGVSSVNADTLDWVNAYREFDSTISSYLQVESRFNTLYSYYENNYQSSYPYYSSCISGTNIILSAFQKNNTIWNGTLSDSNDISLQPDTSVVDNNWVSLVIDSNGSISNNASQFCVLLDRSRRYTTSDSLSLKTNMKLTDDTPISSIEMPQFTSSVHNVSLDSFTWSMNDNIPSYLTLYDGSYETNMFAHYTEINLNNYSYIALSLKDYSITNAFTTNIYTKGQLCSTTLWDYGLKDKYDPTNNNYSQGCTIAYDDFTPVRFYIIDQDLQNNAIYYIKSYNTNIQNIIKVDNDIFNITYIDTQSANNPMVYANGRYYSSIPYDDLSSTATSSEQSGIISGVVCNLGDSDCYYQNTGIDISNLFTHPLQLLQSLWGSITTFFALITAFILLLPPTLQAFMFSAWALAIVLGIIKMIV